jgi:hypothetical protein
MINIKTLKDLIILRVMEPGFSLSGHSIRIKNIFNAFKYFHHK